MPVLRVWWENGALVSKKDPKTTLLNGNLWSWIYQGLLGVVLRHNPWQMVKKRSRATSMVTRATSQVCGLRYDYLSSLLCQADAWATRGPQGSLVYCGHCSVS